MNTKHIIVSSPGFAAGGIERWGLGVIQKIVHSVQQFRQAYRRHRDYRHLETLPDFLLEDIGLTRAEVNAAVKRNRFLNLD